MCLTNCTLRPENYIIKWMHSFPKAEATVHHSSVQLLRGQPRFKRWPSGAKLEWVSLQKGLQVCNLDTKFSFLSAHSLRSHLTWEKISFWTVSSTLCTFHKVFLFALRQLFAVTQLTNLSFKIIVTETGKTCVLLYLHSWSPTIH